MLDTIKLLLTGGYKITNYDLFKNFYPGYLKSLFEASYTNYNGRKYLVSWLLPTKNGTRLRLLITKSPYTNYPYLYIEFSIPKLLFGNNIQEVCEKDFENIVKKILTDLEKIGVETTKEAIENSIVKKCHIARNYILPMPLSCNDIFEMIRASSLPRCKLLSFEDGVRFNSVGFNFVCYNKTKEIISREGKLPSALLKFGIGENRILRMEAQYNKDYRIKSMLQRFEYSPNDNTFKKMFSLTKFQKVFDYILRKLHSNMPDMIHRSQIYETVAAYKTDGQKAKKLALLMFQQNKNYTEAKKEALTIFSKNFVETHTPLLIDDENTRFTLMKLLEETKTFSPLFRTSR